MSGCRDRGGRLRRRRTFRRGGPRRGGTGLLVTVVARECHSYQDVTANLARNNIMESLQDLGADTLYTSGEPINPEKEAEGQPKCTPITGWKFTLGSGIREKASTGPWGALPIVTGAESPVITTQATTPLLGWNGEPNSGQSLRGSGAPPGPLDPGRHHHRPGPLRSAEIRGQIRLRRPALLDRQPERRQRRDIKFPTGTTHAFCYAYYVTPPPGAGMIVIRKEVEGGGSAPQQYQYGGNVSYNPGGGFSLSAADGSPGEETFVRGETRSVKTLGR